MSSLEQLQQKINRLEELLRSAREMSDLRGQELRELKMEKHIDTIRERFKSIPGVTKVTITPMLDIHIELEDREYKDTVYREEMRLLSEIPELNVDFHCTVRDGI